MNHPFALFDPEVHDIIARLLDDRSVLQLAHSCKFLHSELEDWRGEIQGAWIDSKPHDISKYSRPSVVFSYSHGK